MQGDSILDEQDLLDMQITNQPHRKQLLQAIKNLPSLPYSEPITVAEWLSTISLPQYESAFLSSGRDDMSQVRQMTREELRQVGYKITHMSPCFFVVEY